MDQSSPAPATLVISRVMRPGRADDHDAWAERLERSARSAAGFRSAVHLDQAGGLHHLVIQFADQQTLDAWSNGDDYAALSREADLFSVGLDQDRDGVAPRFVIPSEVAAKKWKTAFITWLAVVPTLLTLSSVIGFILPGVPRVLQQIVSSALLTAALTWLILPRVRGWSRFWMLQDSRGNLRKTSG